ncbi:MAG TPA: hypothetical protein VKR29_09535, partial [Candidatus Binataceae bacterium]|nr:hypothetical protein [Candidatus Binataceae bacterium]
HNDGLRYNPRENNLWALQNEDGDANLSIIDLKTGDQKIYQLGTGPHGGGYDDIDFNNEAIFLSASAPTISPNTAPAIVSLKIEGKKAALSESLMAMRPSPTRSPVIPRRLTCRIPIR